MAIAPGILNSSLTASDDESNAPLLLDLCNDAILAIASNLAPSDLARFSVCSKATLSLTDKRMQAIAFARHNLRVGLRRARNNIFYRSLYTQHAVGCSELLSAQECLDQLAAAMKDSPDALRDLAAAVQESLLGLSRQSVVNPQLLKHLQQDLVMVATFVCVSAWRRTRAQHTSTRESEFASLMIGLHNVSANPNPSVRPSAAALNILLHNFKAEVQSWLLVVDAIDAVAEVGFEGIEGIE